jgi:EmrB/QacA subfamily drug resistance transporter
MDEETRTAAEEKKDTETRDTDKKGAETRDTETSQNRVPGDRTFRGRMSQDPASRNVMAGESHGTRSADRVPARLIGAIIATGSLAFIGILTETVMTVLFPQLMREFSVDTSTVQWITTIYLLAVAVTMPLSSYLKRRFRLRTIFVAAVALAVLGSLMMIIVHSFALLIVARVIQGMGSGIATPLMMNIILEQSPRSKIGRLMGVGSLVITVAPAIGPTVGGAVASVLPWRAIYVVVIPVMLVSLIVGLVCIDQKAPTEDAHLNPLQFLTVLLALVSLVFAVNQTGIAVSAAVSGHRSVSDSVLAGTSWVVGVASLLAFGFISRHGFSQLLRISILRDRVVLLHMLTYMIMPMVTIGFGYVITNVAQLSLGTTSFVAGSLVLPGALVGSLCAPLGGWLYDRFGAVRPILYSFAVAAIGPLLLLIFSMHLTPLMIGGFYFIFALGYSIGSANVMTSALSDVPAEFTADGNAIFNTAFQFGGAAGTTLCATILAVAQSGAGAVSSASFRHATAVGGAWTFAVMLLICVVGWLNLQRAFRLRRTRELALR